jgi:ribose transport system ATP-binding protein
MAITDRITVVRDGRYQGPSLMAETTISQIIAAMTGRRLQETFPERAPVNFAPVVLDVRNLRAAANRPDQFSSPCG